MLSNKEKEIIHICYDLFTNKVYARSGPSWLKKDDIKAEFELNEEQFHLLTDRFSPYRTTAALYIWYYANPDCELVIG